MNAINELHRLVGAADSDRKERLMKALPESGLSDAELEAVVGALVDAFREHLKTKGAETETQRCSFCHRTQREVKSLVVATNAAICDECIEIARDTLQPPKKRSWFSRA